jgi:hypothetical protein
VTTGETVAAIVAVNREADGGVSFVPFAVMLCGNPYELLCAPDPDTGGFAPQETPESGGKFTPAAVWQGYCRLKSHLGSLAQVVLEKNDGAATQFAIQANGIIEDVEKELGLSAGKDDKQEQQS